MTFDEIIEKCCDDKYNSFEQFAVDVRKYFHNEYNAIEYEANMVLDFAYKEEKKYGLCEVFVKADKLMSIYHKMHTERMEYIHCRGKYERSK